MPVAVTVPQVETTRGARRWARLVEQTAALLCRQEAETGWDDAPEAWRRDYRQRAGALLVSIDVLDLIVALASIDEVLTAHDATVPSGDSCKVAARALARSALDAGEG